MNKWIRFLLLAVVLVACSASQPIQGIDQEMYGDMEVVDKLEIGSVNLYKVSDNMFYQRYCYVAIHIAYGGVAISCP